MKWSWLLTQSDYLKKWLLSPSMLSLKTKRYLIIYNMNQQCHLHLTTMHIYYQIHLAKYIHKLCPTVSNNASKFKPVTAWVKNKISQGTCTSEIGDNFCV